MTAEQAEKFRYNVLDLTKIWPHKEFPLRPVGQIILNKNVQNYFAEIEQVLINIVSHGCLCTDHFLTRHRLRSHLLTWFLASSLPQIPFSNLVSSPTLIPTVTVSVSTTTNSRSTLQFPPFLTSSVMVSWPSTTRASAPTTRAACLLSSQYPICDQPGHIVLTFGTN